MKAIISPCGNYRYVLRRKIPQVLRWVKPILFIMLNPSTADADTNDPTIRRCIAFAERDGFTDLTVVNLFALRATDPNALLSLEDPIGPDNDLYLTQEIAKHKGGIGTIVCAWGGKFIARKRGSRVLDWIGPTAMCLGVTQAHAPRHPLYLKADTEFRSYP